MKELTYVVNSDRISRLVERSYVSNFNRFSSLKAFCRSHSVLCLISNGLQVHYPKEAELELINYATVTYFPNDMEGNFITSDKNSFYFALPKMGKEYKELNEQFLAFCMSKGAMCTPVKIIRLQVEEDKQRLVERMVQVLFYPEELAK